MPRILIADDHAEVRKGIREMLTDEFPLLYLEEAGDGQELIEKALAESWDLVISDLAMPRAGGMEALRRIRNLNKELPIIIISSYSADQYRRPLMDAGAVDFISKETLTTHLLPAVRKALLL